MYSNYVLYFYFLIMGMITGRDGMNELMGSHEIPRGGSEY